MTFKEQLKNEMDSLTLTDEFKDALSGKMAAQPKSRLHMTAAKIALSAAGLCLLGFGAFEIANLGADFSTRSGTSAANTAAMSAGAACNDAGYENYSYFADDSIENEAEIPLPETAAAEPDGYSVKLADGADSETAYSIDETANCGDEVNDSFDNCDTAGGTVTAESVSRNFSAPTYNGEIICTVQNTYCSDRPLYTAAEMADKIVNSGYKLARVRFGKPLTADEKAEQTAVNSGFEGTYYHAEADGENTVVYFFGSKETQEAGNPIYAEGDEIYCALEENGSVYMIREYPLGDIYTIDGEEFVYLRIQPCELNAAQLLGESVYVTTTTEGNPARYYSAYPLEDFVGEFNELIKNN